MANRPQGEGLEGLTPERLDELALSCTNVADQREGQAIAEASWPDLAALLSAEAHDNRQLAALCRAVAGAERLKRNRIGDFMVKIVAGEVVIDLLSDRRGYARRIMELGKGPTLAAALGSLHPEAGGTTNA